MSKQTERTTSVLSIRADKETIDQIVTLRKALLEAGVIDRNGDVATLIADSMASILDKQAGTDLKGYTSAVDRSISTIRAVLGLLVKEIDAASAQVDVQWQAKYSELVSRYEEQAAALVAARDENARLATALKEANRDVKRLEGQVDRLIGSTLPRS